MLGLSAFRKTISILRCQSQRIREEKGFTQEQIADVLVFLEIKKIADWEYHYW
jgi:hypothetical protein